MGVKSMNTFSSENIKKKPFWLSLLLYLNYTTLCNLQILRNLNLTAKYSYQNDFMHVNSSLVVELLESCDLLVIFGCFSMFFVAFISVFKSDIYLKKMIWNASTVNSLGHKSPFTPLFCFSLFRKTTTVHVESNLIYFLKFL